MGYITGEPPRRSRRSETIQGGYINCGYLNKLKLGFKAELSLRVNGATAVSTQVCILLDMYPEQIGRVGAVTLAELLRQCLLPTATAACSLKAMEDFWLHLSNWIYQLLQGLTNYCWINYSPGATDLFCQALFITED